MDERMAMTFRLALGLKHDQPIPDDVERTFLGFKKPYDRLGGGAISPQTVALIILQAEVEVTEKPKAAEPEKSVATPAVKVKAEPSAVLAWAQAAPGTPVRVVNRDVVVGATLIGPGTNDRLKVKLGDGGEVVEVSAHKLLPVEA